MARNQHGVMLAEKLAGQLDAARMWQDLQQFGQLHRYSGSKDGEKTVDLIEARMRELGIVVKRERYDLYRSLPLGGKVSAGELCLNVTPYVYSGCASRLQAPLIFDAGSETPGRGYKALTEQCAAFKGKIVLTYESSFIFARCAHKAGAAAVLTIWPAELAHHGTLGGVWGSPEPEDLLSHYPLIPFGEVVYTDGQKLRQLAEQGEGAELDIEMDNGVVQSSMPIAFIPGRSEKYVLVSGHYDSWYEGATDNGVANVAMMDLARVLQENQDGLERTVVLAWWSGHSDGRYSGSTWYYDNHWADLQKNCVAHLNMDICGCRGSDFVGFNTSQLEGAAFCADFLRPFNDSEPPAPIPMARFADQTFWGADVPFTIMPRFSKKKLEKGRPFYWWHTKEDGVDKVDEDIMMRDSRVIALLTGIFAAEKKLPADFIGFAAIMRTALKEIERALAPELSMEPVWPAFEQMEGALHGLQRALDQGEAGDDAVKNVGGLLTRLMYTAADRYHQDLAVEGGTFPGLRQAAGKEATNCQPEEFLAIQTAFVRQRNRLTDGLEQAVTLCEKMSGEAKCKNE